MHDRGDPPPRPINYQFLNRRLLWDHWAKMAYAVAPLVNWGSVRRAVSSGAARLRREARALGIFGGGRGSMLLAGRRARGVSGDTDGDAAAAAVLTACAECGTNPAKVRAWGLGICGKLSLLSSFSLFRVHFFVELPSSACAHYSVLRATTRVLEFVT